MIAASVAAILFGLPAEASPLRMTLLLERDSFLPYEPIFAQVTVTNLSDEDVPIPSMKSGIAATVLSYSIRAADGTVIPGVRGPFTTTVDPPPRSRARVLAPGESASMMCDIANRSGESDPESKGTRCLLPGYYSLGASWNLRVLSSDRPWSHDTSNRLRFVVRSAIGDERQALELYRDVEYYATYANWRDSEFAALPSRAAMVAHCSHRLTVQAQRLLCEYPVEPYATLAAEKLDHALWQRVFGAKKYITSPGGDAALRDSMRALYRETLLNYPDSYLAADYLRRTEESRNVGGPVSTLDDPADIHRFLEELANKHPASPVGREARRQLGLR